MALKDFIHFKAGETCWICGHVVKRGEKWCAHSADASVVFCGRENQGAFRAAKNGTGWLHRMKADGDARAEPLPTWSAARRAQATPTPTPAPTAPAVDFPAFVRACELQARGEQVKRLADSLGLNVTSLRRLGIGWADAVWDAALGRHRIAGTSTGCRPPGCWIFPMRDADRRVIGVRVRSGDAKYSIDGSDGSGLFIPRGLSPGGLLLAAEGPTSAAALLVMGLCAVGRPNNRAGSAHLCRLIRRMRPARVVLFGDNDRKEDGRWPGLEGARAVAADVARVWRGDVRVVMPPDPVKDVRDWLQAGGVASDVLRRIEAAGSARGLRDAG